VHDHDGGALDLHLHRPDLHVDRQRLLDRAVEPAAGAEALVAAEHDQAGPHVVDVRLQQLLLRLGEDVLRDVAQDDRVVGLQLRQVAGQLVAADDAAAPDLAGGQAVTSSPLSRSAWTSSSCSPRVPSIRRTRASPRAW
jgi:hypothetical protein